MTSALKLGRRERNKQRNRSEILEAALHEFSEKGFHEASIQAIALRSEFSVGSIYTLFGSKEDLYRDLLIQHAEESRIAFTEALQQSDNEYEQLVNYVEAKGRLFANRMELARLIFTETLGTGVSFKSGPNPELKLMYDVWHEALAHIISSGIEKGIFRDVDPMGMAVALEGLTNHFIYQSQEDPNGFTYERGVQVLHETFFKSILADTPQAAGSIHDTGDTPGS